MAIKMTLNLYSGRRYNTQEVQMQVLNKDPVIFIVPNEVNDSVYSILNISKDLRKYICLASSFNVAKVVSFLVSFKDGNNRRVLIMAPQPTKDDAISFSRDVLGHVNRIFDSRKFKIFKRG